MPIAAPVDSATKHHGVARDVDDRYGVSAFCLEYRRDCRSCVPGMVHYLESQRNRTGVGEPRIGTMLALLVLLLTLPVVEFLHRRMPLIEGVASEHLVVIGDFISSGLNSRVTPWPLVMQQVTGVAVKNLSQPGATMTDGLAMVDQVTTKDHLILIELGGNDLLAGEPSDAFARELEEVLAKLVARGRMILMFELPLLPDRISYGRIQRRLATKYGVSLIPKRYLVSVIRGPDATSDGLHLTDVGAHRMASLVMSILSPVLKTGSPRPPATHP